jgi:large subunit ribosomal protein L10
MVSEEKKREVARIRELIEKYPVIGILDFFKMPSRQLQSIRKSLRGTATIKMCKKRLMERALKEVKGKKDIEKLNEFPVKEPALIFTEINPFKLFKILKKNKSLRYAKAKDIAPDDIIVPAGPTSLPAGPAIGELQRIKIPAMVKEGKIHVREDTVVVKKGEEISSQIANVLKKLDIQPIEIGINLLGVWENGIVYGKDILDVDEEAYKQMIKEAHVSSLNLCVNVCYPNKESIKILIVKAYQHGKNLGLNAAILDEGVVEDLIAKAVTQASALEERLKI